MLEPFVPKNQSNIRRADGQWVISGIIHIFATCERRRDCRVAESSHTTVYNCYDSCYAMLAALAEAGRVGETADLALTCIKAYGSAHSSVGA